MSEIEIVVTLSKPSETQLGNISISDRLLSRPKYQNIRYRATSDSNQAMRKQRVQQYVLLNGYKVIVGFVLFLVTIWVTFRVARVT